MLCPAKSSPAEKFKVLCFFQNVPSKMPQDKGVGKSLDPGPPLWKYTL